MIRKVKCKLPTCKNFVKSRHGGPEFCSRLCKAKVRFMVYTKEGTEFTKTDEEIISKLLKV